MISLRGPGRRREGDEGEKPFWISFSDLMTALMVLFLIATSGALMAATKKVSEVEQAKRNRDSEIEKLLNQIRESAKEFPEIHIHGHSVDFGDGAHFRTDSHHLEASQAHFLREFVPRILDAARSPLGQKWIKRVIVDGFADQRGTYIHNLNLSMQRSERVMCTLLSPSAGPKQDALSEKDRLTIRELFLVGGSSFNSMRPSFEQSRRIELKLEFLESGEQKGETPNIPLDSDPRCPLDKS